MPMELLRLNKSGGFSIMEVLIAIGIFSIVATAGVGTFVTATRLQEQAVERDTATAYAASGLEAVRNIKDENFTLLETGTHGVAVVNDVWELSGDSNDTDGYTREIVITDVEDEVKEVTARVIWDSRFGARETSLTTQFTDWEKLIVTTPSVNIEISGAYIFGKQSKNLQGITLENTGATDLVLDTITISWTPDINRKINAITIAGNLVWSNSGPGEPSGNQSPGTTIDIVDVILPAGGGPVTIDSFDFNGNMKDNVFDITFTMSDGSAVLINDLTPPLI